MLVYISDEFAWRWMCSQAGVEAAETDRRDAAGEHINLPDICRNQRPFGPRLANGLDLSHTRLSATLERDAVGLHASPVALTRVAVEFLGPAIGSQVCVAIVVRM